ncbi:MAG: hypothetical protein NC416_05430 [Eubacterium sp.]|nr:hypothetical protein [Eubacterium sp.]
MNFITNETDANGTSYYFYKIELMANCTRDLRGIMTEYGEMLRAGEHINSTSTITNCLND